MAKSGAPFRRTGAKHFIAAKSRAAIPCAQNIGAMTYKGDARDNSAAAGLRSDCHYSCGTGISIFNRAFYWSRWQVACPADGNYSGTRRSEFPAFRLDLQLV